MKVKSFRAPRLLVATVAQGRTILRGFGFLFRTHKLFTFAFVAVIISAGASLFPSDAEWLGRLHFWGPAENTAHNVSWYLSTWGDYPTYNFPLALLIWLYGVWRKSSAWRRIAVVCFLGATLAGLCDDCFRLTLGRPRPDAHVEDGFYGISHAFQGKFQSFPSGHAAAVFGTAAALLVVEYPLGVVTTLFAFAVIWARMELYRHYPSDIIVGSGIGLYFGFMIGLGAKLRRPRPFARRPAT